LLIVGELINSSRKAVREAIEKKDAKFIQDLALKQIEAGATYVDINCGTQIYEEEATMQWLVNSVLEVSDAPLCIDSPSEKALAAGLEAAVANKQQPMINSITGEKERYAAVLELVKQYDAKVVGLLMDDTGMPETYEDRVRITDKLVQDLQKDGVALKNVFLDPLVKPVSTGDQAGMEVLATIRYIHEKYADINTVCGLSNISFGLPNRKLLNQVFMIQTMTMGMNGYILDPLDRKMMGLVHTSMALLGKDQYCTGYLKAYRKGLLD